MNEPDITPLSRPRMTGRLALVLAAVGTALLLAANAVQAQSVFSDHNADLRLGALDRAETRPSASVAAAQRSQPVPKTAAQSPADSAAAPAAERKVERKAERKVEAPPLKRG